MLPVIILVSLLLPILAAGSSTVQQDRLCTDSYVEFESASIGSNDTGSDIRNQLYEAFYAPNQHLPYSVIVTYQLVLTNGTRVNLSSDPDCSSELWGWLSSPVFLIGDTTCLSQMLLFTLNYFIINSTTAPCPEFLSEMTASVRLQIEWCFSLLNQSSLISSHVLQYETSCRYMVLSVWGDGHGGACKW